MNPMSDLEKAQQIGEAVSEYQAAKVEAAHVEKKVEKVFHTYRQVGETMDTRRGTTYEPTIVNGKIQFGYSSFLNASDLLNGDDLMKVLEERDQARKRLSEATKAMHSLGITGLS
jgi:hypothetical protein